jgi:hypothetical protein
MGFLSSAGIAFNSSQAKERRKRRRRIIIIRRNGAKTISLPNFVWET